MTEPMTRLPAVFDWERLREQLAASPDLRPMGLGQVHIGAGTIQRLPATVADLLDGRDGDIVLLRDAVPKRIGARDLHQAVQAELAALTIVRDLVLTGPHGVVHADEPTVDAVVAATADAAVLVTVGSGTLADLGKMAAATHGLPHLILQTAASVNGFADDQSVLLRSGVKRTVASRWPDALIVDADILVEAPPELNRAGVGDLLSMFTAPADWLLAHEAGVAQDYHQVPVDMVRAHGERLLSLAPRLAAADGDALATLAELLTLSGVSMGVAGCTAPSSGLEHLISHLLDMHCLANGCIADSHGTQVGVGSLVATATWSRVRAVLGTGAVPDLRLPEPDQARRRIEEAFLPLDDSGRTAAECWTAYAAKLRRVHDLAPLLRSMLARWPEVDARLDAVLVETGRLARALRTLGAPVRFADLRPGYSERAGRWAVANAHLMRDRFTVADLNDLLGLGGDGGAEAVLSDVDDVAADRPR